MSISRLHHHFGWSNQFSIVQPPVKPQLLLHQLVTSSSAKLPPAAAASVAWPSAGRHPRSSTDRRWWRRGKRPDSVEPTRTRNGDALRGATPTTPKRRPGKREVSEQVKRNSHEFTWNLPIRIETWYDFKMICYLKYRSMQHLLAHPRIFNLGQYKEYIYIAYKERRGNKHF
jgi:hypothetical protein